MSDAELPPVAWEPLTPRGVAAFARAGLGRLLLVQLLVAGLAGTAVAGFLYEDWCPVARAAIRALPGEGDISAEQLHWSGATPVQLAANPFLGIAVDLNHSNVLGRGSHLQLEFGRQDVRLISLLGYVPLEYPPGWRMPFNRTELGPWWGAWQPALLAAAGLGVVAALLVIWTVLATLYLLPVRVITFFEHRNLNWRQSWRLGGAALMPGALFLTFAIFAYSLGLIDLIRLGGLAALHFLMGGVYLVISPLFLPRNPTAAIIKANPFGPANDSGEAEKKGSTKPQ